MAGAGDATITETPEYRIVVLFMVFIAITFLFEKLAEWVDHHLKKNKRRGLLHTIHKLEEEILALGLISLLLNVFEVYIIEICIDSDRDAKKGKKEKKASSQKGAVVEEDTSEADALAAEIEGTDAGADALTVSEDDDEPALVDATLTDDLSNRRLLGGVMRMLLAGGGDESVCPEGDESFWSIATLHQTHIFIFVLAAVHIVYSGLSVLLCSWKVNQWKQWEARRHDDLTRIDCSHLLDTRNPFVHYWRAFWSQFHQHIDQSVYLGFRRLFIERMELDSDFEFHQFLVNSMEEEFSKVVKLDWTMWAIAAVWIVTDASVVYIMTGLGLVFILLAGMKLESITLKLGNEAYLMYSGKPGKGCKKSSNVVVRNLARFSSGITHFLSGNANVKSDSVDSNNVQNSRDSDYRVGHRRNASEQSNRRSIDIMPSEAVGADIYRTVEGSTPVQQEGSGMCGSCFGCCGSSESSNDMRNIKGNTFSQTYKVCDSAHLFPFQKPRWMLRLFQYIYFETSLIMAVLLFNVWQEVDPDFILSPNAVAYVEVGIGIVTMMITSILLLPVYWLTMVVGSHCPEKVLKKAKKKNVSPEVVIALERTSMSLKQTSVNVARQSTNRTSVVPNKKSTPALNSSGSNHSTAGQQITSGFPTHWADLENVPEAYMVPETVVPPQAVEESHSVQQDALGMLVGAMLKTKQKELESRASDGSVNRGARGLERRSVSGANEVEPSPERKSKPLLQRISVPLLTLPVAKEAKKPKGQQGQVAESRSADYYGTRAVASAVAGPSTETTMMRKSKSEQDLTDEILQGGAPSLARRSLLSTKVVELKQTAYLARERQNAEHMMQESNEEDDGMPSQSAIGRVASFDAAYLARERQNAEHMMLEGAEEDEEETPRVDGDRIASSGLRPSGSWFKGGAELGKAGAKPSVNRPGDAKDEAKRVFSSHKDEARKVFKARPKDDGPRGTTKPAPQRVVLHHVAELYKLGEKQKHQRE